LGDRLYGDAAANGLFGLAGNDELAGSGGDDLIEPGFGSDTVFGGPGADKVSYFNDQGAAGVGIDLGRGMATRGAEPDRLAEVENADGTNNVDTLTGNALVNLLGGAGGNDVLFGREGNDTLLGAVGNDRLAGEAGRDRLTGGRGNDVFDFNAVGESAWSTGRTGCDIITDFARGDRLDFSTIDARSATALDDAFTFLAKSGAGFMAAGQIRWYQSNGSTFVEASNDTDLVGELQVQLAGLKALTAADFIG
jgi:Ca2+-binding RTX toxin-like protein